MFYTNREKRSSSKLKERSVKHIKIIDTKTLYDVYEFKEEIGHGSYGTVISAIEKQTSKNYAIKIVNKFTTGLNKLQEIYSEINILKVVEHPNIIHLERVYESPKKIYMVLEKCRTSLDTVFIEEQKFTEKVTRNIIKQLVNAVYYLHKNDIVHRDIKLENILLTNKPDDPSDNYFIKLSDFGFGVFKTGAGVDNMLKEYCGTVIYMAPEILLKHTYSELCDIWSIGVIMYLLLFGKFPFFSTEDSEIEKKICSSPLTFNNAEIVVGFEAQDLLSCLLEKEPMNRISALEVLQHPWIVNNKVKLKKDDNVLEYMKKWKNEMRIPTVDNELELLSSVIPENIDEAIVPANRGASPLDVCVAASKHQVQDKKTRYNSPLV